MRTVFWITLLFCAALSDAENCFVTLEALLRHAVGPEKVEVLNDLSLAHETQSVAHMEAYARRALALAEQIGDELGKARALNNLALAFRDTGRLQEASKTAQDALALYVQNDQQMGQALTLNILGSIRDVGCDFNESIRYYQKSLIIFHKMDHEEGISNALHNIGSAYSEMGQFDVAIEHIERAIDIKKKLGLMDRAAVEMTGLAVNYVNQGNYTEAKQIIQQALEIQERIGDKKNKAFSLNTLGVINSMTGDNDSALKYYQESHEIHREVGNMYGVAIALNNIGIVHERRGQYETALKYYQEALEIDQNLNNKQGLIREFNNIGNIHKNLGRFDKAKQYFEDSKEIADAIGDQQTIAQAWNNLGSIHESLGAVDDARRCFEKSLEGVRQLGDRSGEVQAIINLAFLAEKVGALDEAQEKATQALDLAREIGEREEEVESLTILGRAQRLKGNPEDGIETLTSALNIANEINVSSLIQDACSALSDAYADVGDHAQALAHLRRYVTAKDAALNETSQAKIAELEAKYEAEKRETQIAMLTKDNEIQRLKISRERFRKNAWIAGFLLVLLVSGILLRYYVRLFVFWKKRQFIGQYRIIDQIGSGGMGVVYQARRVLSGSQRVAVKVIRDDLSQDPSLRRRFLNEALIIDRLDHPHIVKVIERGEHDSRLYMVMEFLEGRSLTQVIGGSTRFPLEDAWDIMGQLVDTVLEIHAKGIVHRDLKPDNIMLIASEAAPHQFVKLLDFGLARTETLTRLTETGEILGTVNYLPPERITQQATTPAGDIYALGVIFYEMLTGEKPFAGEAPVDVIRAILDVEPLPLSTFRPDVPGSVERIIMAMMSKTPQARPDGPALKAFFDAADWPQDPPLKGDS